MSDIVVQRGFRGADVGVSCVHACDVFAVVTTVAGGVVNGNSGTFADATGSNAGFNRPTGVAVDSSGNIYCADLANHRIRKVTPGGGTGRIQVFNKNNGAVSGCIGRIDVYDWF